MTEKEIKLFFTDDRSDKVYNAQLKKDGDGYRVFFQNGARNKTMKGGEKTKSPLPYDKAEKIYTALVKSKTGKGYTEDTSGVTFSSAEHSDRKTDFSCQLLNVDLNPNDTSEDAMWLAQEKYDGERCGVIISDGNIIFSNKKGLERGINQDVLNAFKDLLRSPTHDFGDASRFKLDGEDMGGWIAVFDIPSHPDLPEAAPFSVRAGMLESLRSWVSKSKLDHIIHVDVPLRMDHFRSERLPELIRNGREGYVKRRVDSVYTPGRPASGGDAMKVPFTANCSVKVASINDGKRSVAISLLDVEKNEWYHSGNVTIPQNAEIPDPGSVIDVTYLYATKASILYQPVFKCVRNDVDPDECLKSQLKYRGETESPVQYDPGMEL